MGIQMKIQLCSCIYNHIVISFDTPDLDQICKNLVDMRMFKNIILSDEETLVSLMLTMTAELIKNCFSLMDEFGPKILTICSMIIQGNIACRRGKSGDLEAEEIVNCTV